MSSRPSLPPGPTAWPLVGNSMALGGKYKDKIQCYFEDMRRQYGNVYRVYLGDVLFIVLNDKESIDEAFVEQADVFNNRPADAFWVVAEGNKSGIGITWANGDAWKARRGLLLETMNLGESHLENIIETGVKDAIQSLTDAQGNVLQYRDLFLKAALNVYSTVVFGKRFDPSDPEFLNITEVTSNSFESAGIFSKLNVFPAVRYLPFISTKLKTLFEKIGRIRTFLSDLIATREKDDEAGEPRDLLGFYLAKKKHDSQGMVSDNDIIKTFLEMFGAASATITATMEWALLYMILHPEVQKKCQDEIEKVVGSGRAVKWSDRSALVYTQATLLEIQRMGSVTYTSVPVTPTKDAVVSGYLIPKGSVVVSNLYSLHNHSHLWNDPQLFKPERFFDDEGKLGESVNLIPFSLGQRKCPGALLARMEIFLFFTNVLQSFSLSGSGDLSTVGNTAIFLTPPPFHPYAKKRNH